MPEAVLLPRSQWTWSKCNREELRELQAIVIDYSCKTILLQRQKGLLLLPGYLGNVEEYSSCYSTEFVIRALPEVIGVNLELVVLRQVWREEMRIVANGEEWTNEKAVVLLEVQKRSKHATFKEGFFWSPLQEAEVFHLFPAALRAVQDEINNAQYDIIPTNRLDWQRPGWMSQTLSWAKEVLSKKIGVHSVTHIVPERLSPFGVVLELQTPEGRFFIKSTPPYANDAMYIKLLSYLAPQYVSSPLAIHEERRILLTADYGTILEPCGFEEKDCIKLSMDYAKLQQIASSGVDQLVAAGMPDMRLASLSSQLNSIASHPVLKELLMFDGMENAVSSFGNMISKLQEEANLLLK